ncbi:MAG: ATP-binding protein, partial [Acidimicrobiales bacterium]
MAVPEVVQSLLLEGVARVIVTSDDPGKWDDADFGSLAGGGRVEVRDRGPGVDAADRPFVFDRFFRAPGARSRPGSGLGLAIVQRVADLHGGRVSLDERPGGGSIAVLELSRLAATAAGAEQSPRRNAAARRPRP